MEDNIDRLVQQVQDGWCIPKSCHKQVPDSCNAQKFILLALDFTRACDIVDQHLLMVSVLEVGVPEASWSGSGDP